MKWYSSSLLLPASVFVYLSFVPPETGAIPAFARRYKMSCTTCHAPFPRLKAYGDEFAANGFYIPEEEKERDYVTGGDPLLWLNKTFPVAVRFEAFGFYESPRERSTSDETNGDFQTPWGVKLLSGGPLAKNVGYYFYFYLSEQGEVAGIEDAYIHFNNLFGSELDIILGQFQVCDPLMKRELRLTYEDYQIYKQQIGESRVNLAYDRGIMIPFAIPRTKTDIVAMVVNGSGIRASYDETYDRDDYKNFAFRVAQAVTDQARIGGFAYYGKEQHSWTESETIYFGGDVGFDLPWLAFSGQYLFRKDQNPDLWNKYFHFEPQLYVETHGVVAELVVSPDMDKSRYYFTALHNWIHSDHRSVGYETTTLNVTYLLARNVRLLAECTYDWVWDGSRGVLGIVSAF